MCLDGLRYRLAGIFEEEVQSIIITDEKFPNQVQGWYYFPDSFNHYNTYHNAIRLFEVELSDHF